MRAVMLDIGQHGKVIAGTDPSEMCLEIALEGVSGTRLLERLRVAPIAEQLDAAALEDRCLRR